MNNLTPTQQAILEIYRKLQKEMDEMQRASLFDRMLQNRYRSPFRR